MVTITSRSFANAQDDIATQSVKAGSQTTASGMTTQKRYTPSFRRVSVRNPEQWHFVNDSRKWIPDYCLWDDDTEASFTYNLQLKTYSLKCFVRNPQNAVVLSPLWRAKNLVVKNVVIPFQEVIKFFSRSKKV
ncbi:MAG TPA: hypothetical protein DEE98_03800 [Elusimicrobia bacterium]|nr:MAG: hypothetical protein A2278_01130 [Elusimicrobia bacterium RIFOXYA12_FULL_49_49]OGS11085.1 MAG: hypothetical protein A2386_03690 [Elusimicrobia bacterium RIFOXYB1_FULL_48_9]OGS15800.1 MAG: hypothetical protein A2251_04030 [Elusimicrobia bacterium RIFOXYA2_FULL_47_53]OGS25988.1 MAG: hypothetical protein A2339_05420 [Elusimicrobia bacterium RIFOXYB12_FULL_50_12]OGS31132.1 MAG: hypothetical protein A2323_08750 [Elusimicrobia bacterium RIFOXYB2_FULL_46_23]HBU69490.1 hypothetical protein [El